MKLSLVRKLEDHPRSEDSVFLFIEETLSHKDVSKIVEDNLESDKVIVTIDERFLDHHKEIGLENIFIDFETIQNRYDNKLRAGHNIKSMYIKGLFD